MSALAQPIGLYADKLPQAEAFEAWCIPTGLGADRKHKANPLALNASSFDEAVTAATLCCQHKDTLAVLYTHPGKDERTLRLYAIKREAKAIYVRNPQTGETERVQRLYPALLLELAVNAFDPVEPWRWSLGADVVGIDPQLVEAAS